MRDPQDLLPAVPKSGLEDWVRPFESQGLTVAGESNRVFLGTCYVCIYGSCKKIQSLSRMVRKTKGPRPAPDLADKINKRH